MHENEDIDFNTFLEKHSIVSRTDLAGNITYVNPNYCDISGYVHDELIGKKPNLIRHPDVSKKFYEQLWQTIESDDTWHGILKNLDKEGKEYYTNATIFPITNEADEKIGYMSIHYLVTDEEHIKHNLKKQLLIYKSEQLKHSRELKEHDNEIKQHIEQDLQQKYGEFVHNLEEELKRVRLAHRKDVSTIRSLEDELKEKTNTFEAFMLKSKKTIQGLSAERLELIQSSEGLKKSNENLKEKLEKAQGSIVTFQGYIDEYRKKIDDLKDVIASYEAEKNQEAKTEASEKNSDEISSEKSV